MVRPREGTYRHVMVNLDPSETDVFLGNIPRNKSLSEILREYIHDENVRIEKEKKVMGHEVNRSPITTIRASTNKQNNLDMYFGHRFMDYENWEERQKIFNELSDKKRIEIMTALTRNRNAWSGLLAIERARNKL
jgi:hypothetical protein